MPPEVRNNAGRSQFELLSDGRVVGAAEYRIVDDRFVFTHTEIDDGHEGEGLGSALVRSALDEVRAAGRRIVPLCPFVASWIEHHADYADLVDDELTDQLST